ncbi:hypothetical protein CXF85_07200 [Colwellia sp. 75C3]|uniref:hypothetical protein n=1 Tax=Colwellia sp. 75C3 TaxID=888425 RepID=UPI000C322D26|nr:hypothetical protein [Colwellia sp. 75C3]PKG85367.1 hypothetical protein CXF85_07200 [Colwellia sp. 75C3]
MNKNKVLLGVICAAIATGFIYNQQESANESQLGVNSEVIEQSSKSKLTNALDSTTNKESITDGTLVTAVASEELQDDNATSLIIPSISSQQKVSVLSKADNKPSDHFSENQPKHHGHEHDQQKRHPEDNSIIPPGEPKKPLPEQQSKG